jgi:hypothetical protein
MKSADDCTTCSEDFVSGFISHIISLTTSERGLPISCVRVKKLDDTSFSSTM